MNYDPLTFLTRGEKEDIMTFFKWLHDNSRITKVSTSQEYKRVYFMLYRRSVGHSLHAKIAQDILNEDVDGSDCVKKGCCGGDDAKGSPKKDERSVSEKTMGCLVMKKDSWRC